MPNWCEGVLKVRGTRQNIIDYLQELVQKPIFKLSEELQPEIIFSDDGYEIKFEIKNFDYFYLKNTRRAFIDTDEFEFYLWEDEEDSEKIAVASISNFKQAWGIIPANYTELSKKHNVDIRIFGYELGMEFTQEVEIHKGVVVKNIECKYDDYAWEVPFSNLGG